MLFDIIPVMALVMDAQGRVYAINEITSNLIGKTNEEVYLKQNGEILQCVHRNDDPRGCGFGPYCQTCIIRTSAIEATKGEEIRRKKGRFVIEGKDQYKEMNLLVSAAPVEYKGEKLAVIILEDVSFVTELEGLIPICVSCKRIRDTEEDWISIERYIEKKSEAEFTHDICPDCRTKLYPDLNDHKES